MYESDGKIVPTEQIELLGYQTKLLQQSNKPVKQVMVNADGSRGSFYYRRRARYAGSTTDLRRQLILDAEQWDEEGHIVAAGGMVYNGRPEHFQANAPSDLPIAVGVESSASRGMGRLIATTAYERVKVEALGFPSRAFSTDDRPGMDVYVAMLPKLEAIARRTIANLADERLAEAGVTEIGNNPVATFRCEVTGGAYYQLAEWAVARGWSVGTPDKVPCVTLTKGGREILLPLAAMQAKVDGQWRDLGDCVAEKEGRWLVPASLDDLVQ